MAKWRAYVDRVFKNKSYNNREARKKGKERIMENTKGQSIVCYLVLSWLLNEEQ